MVIGETLAHYEILEELGAGGMGTVYRARDSRLDRDVAVKALPEAVAEDPDRLTRFQREAKALASLNHPHIGAIYGLEELHGRRYLVLELVEGLTLAERVRRGPLPVQESLEIARQVAEGLEAAHERGIVHRDIKPANVGLTPAGDVKILDFGLAKPLPVSSESDATRSPTLTGPLTQAGMLVGTAAYMSPEQVLGRAADKRVDVWAFGCLLFEMLTGTSPFRGESSTETLGRILETEPEWDLLPESLPHRARWLLERCLEKDPYHRLRDLGDARIELRAALTRDELTELPVERRWNRALPALLGGVAGAAVVAILWVLAGSGGDRPALPPISRWLMAIPPDQELVVSGRSHPLALSPDGRRLAYVADTGRGSQLYLRPLGELEPRPIRGTEGAWNPFFSPDGEWIGFFSGRKLHVVAVGGGAPEAICDVPLDSLGADWGPDDTIVFASYSTGLWRVEARGRGEPESLTRREVSKGEISHRWPRFLPGGRKVLFTIGGVETSRLAVLSLDDGTYHTIRGVSDVTRGEFVRTGHLLFSQAGKLLAIPWDTERLEVRGTPVEVLSGIFSVPYWGLSYFAVSDSGTVAYVAGLPASESRLVWVDRQGEVEVITEDEAPYLNPSLSPDGRRVLVTVGSMVGRRRVWVLDVERGTRRLLTREGSGEQAVWSPDGSRVAFGSDRRGPWGTFVISSDGSGSAEPLLTGDNEHWAQSWSSSGLAYYEIHPQRARDIWVLPSISATEATPVAVSASNERSPRFSPDGSWVAFVSDESGQDEVYVQPFPGPGGRKTVSTGGGREPVWSPDGRELFYRDGEWVMVVDVAYEPSFAVSKPRRLFRGQFETNVVGNPNWDVHPAGERFLMVQGVQSTPSAIHFVLNWFQEIERRTARQSSP